MKVYLGSDHAGYELKEKLKVYLSELKYEVEDRGPFAFVPNDDYPDFIKLVAEDVAKDSENSFGVVLGGGGQGEAMVCNRYKGVRAMVFYGPKEPMGEIDIAGNKSADTFEQVKLARAHNNANVISLSARFVSVDEAKFAVELFLSTKFSGDERHVRRINKF
jgi:ribose 5-phosphate isomerase B